MFTFFHRAPPVWISSPKLWKILYLQVMLIPFNKDPVMISLESIQTIVSWRWTLKPKRARIECLWRHKDRGEIIQSLCALQRTLSFDLTFILTISGGLFFFTDDQSERDADIMRGEVSLQRYVKKVSHSLISFIQLPHNLQVSSFALKSFFGWLICAPS